MEDLAKSGYMPNVKEKKNFNHSSIICLQAGGKKKHTKQA
jgi:hypothetical protein